MLSGRVWAPGNAIGMVPAGHEIPVFGALVWVTNQKPAQLPRGVHCEQCSEPSGRFTYTDHEGNFSLTGLPTGDQWLIVQKGLFRRSTMVTVGSEIGTALDTSVTTLPSRQDYANGEEIPHIAIAGGTYDKIESVLGKLGLGEVDTAGSFVPASASGVFDVYANYGALGSGELSSVAAGDVQSLVENYDKMAEYHIIFLPCSVQTYGGGLTPTGGLAGAPTAVLENIRRFVNAGGKIYVTDYSGEYADNVFPEQMKLKEPDVPFPVPGLGTIDTPPDAWNGTSWDTTKFGNSDGASYTSLNAAIVDQDMNTWLSTQQGPLVSSPGAYGSGTYNANKLVIEGSYNEIDQLVDVLVGTDMNGAEVYDRPRAYVQGDQDGSPSDCTGGACSTVTATFEPTGCGKVMYSSYHTANAVHTGLVPQERILLYLILEIAQCKAGPIVN